MQLPEVAFLLSILQVNISYSLLRTLRTFCCENPDVVVNTTAALVQLRPLVMYGRRTRFRCLHPLGPSPNYRSLDGDLRDEQQEYAENVYIYHLINTATALANASRKDVGGPHTAVQDVSVGFGMDRMRLNVVCKEPLGVVVYTDPAEEDEGELDTMLDENYGAKTLEHNERIHYGDLKDLLPTAQRLNTPAGATLNTRTKLSPAEVRLLVNQGRYPKV